jgi:predicted lipoprotein with Yx(FWY)xxD motif
MTRTLHVLVFAVLLAALAAPSLAAEPNVGTAHKEDLGTFLVDGQGMTLYKYTRDEPGESTCYGSCIDAWPAFHVDEVRPGPGLSADDFTTITRDDGSSQTAYKKMPLYYYQWDNKPGDTTGQDVGGVWYVVAP